MFPTVYRNDDRNGIFPGRADVKRRFVALGWSQNGTARRIRKDPGLFSRWIRGLLTSSVIEGRVLRALDREETRRAHR